jgi:uncharacterized protein YbjT (DUF2867 family)
MTSGARTLVVGATGFLGMETVRLLTSEGKSVRAAVRAQLASGDAMFAKNPAVERMVVDLKERASLEAACRGVTAVISTATAMRSRQKGDSIDTVDEQGQLALVDAAEREGVTHFVFISFPPVEVDFALQRAKRRVEARLRESRMSFTILQAAHFSEVWLSPGAGFDPAHGRVRIWGDGDRPVSWISSHDVARFAVAALRIDEFAGKELPLGGPDAMTPLQVVRIFEELGAPSVALEHIPESALEAQVASAKDGVEEAYAAIALTTARAGMVVDARPALRLLPGRLTTVREYAVRMLKTSETN